MQAEEESDQSRRLQVQPARLPSTTSLRNQTSGGLLTLSSTAAQSPSSTAEVQEDAGNGENVAPSFGKAAGAEAAIPWADRVRYLRLSIQDQATSTALPSSLNRPSTRILTVISSDQLTKRWTRRTLMRRRRFRIAPCKDRRLPQPSHTSRLKTTVQRNHSFKSGMAPRKDRLLSRPSYSACARRLQYRGTTASALAPFLKRPSPCPTSHTLDNGKTITRKHHCYRSASLLKKLVALMVSLLAITIAKIHRVAFVVTNITGSCLVVHVIVCLADGMCCLLPSPTRADREPPHKYVNRRSSVGIAASEENT